MEGGRPARDVSVRAVHPADAPELSLRVRFRKVYPLQLNGRFCG